MTLSTAQYVPGASKVLLVGTIAQVNSAVGTLALGGLSVDYSAALAAGSERIVAGQTIAVIGVQSAPNMPLVASAIQIL